MYLGSEHDVSLLGAHKNVDESGQEIHLNDTLCVHALEKIDYLIQKIRAQSGIFEFEIRAQLGVGYEITSRSGSLERVSHNRNQELMITLYSHQRSASCSTTDFSPQAIQRTLEQAIALSKEVEPDPFSGLPDRDTLAFQYKNLSLYHPCPISMKKIIDLATHCDERIMSQNALIAQTETSITSDANFLIYANAHGFLGHYLSTEHCISSEVLAQNQTDMVRDGAWMYTRSYDHLIPEKHLQINAQLAAERATSRLNGRRISTQRCSVIFDARVASSLCSHFLKAIQGPNLYTHCSFLEDSLGTMIFPKWVQINQKPHVVCGNYSAPFDAEGVLTRDCAYVVDGCVEHYVLDSYSARKLGLNSTGNAGGLYNLSMYSDCSVGSMTQKEMLAEMGTGFFVTELLGQGVNLLTGDYSRGAAGFWVEQGCIQFAVHEVTIAGNLKNMFSHMLAIGNDEDHSMRIKTGSIWIHDMMIGGA